MKILNIHYIIQYRVTENTVVRERFNGTVNTSNI